MTCEKSLYFIHFTLAFHSTCSPTAKFFFTDEKKQTCESLINVPDVSPRLRCVQEINSAVRYFLRGWKGEEKSRGAKISGRSILSFTGRLAPKKGAKLLHTLNKFADGGKGN